MCTRELKPPRVAYEPTMELLKFVISDLKLNAGAYYRILKEARTIADLASPESAHVLQKKHGVFVALALLQVTLLVA